MPKYECPKCSNGKGIINAFYHVLGGVCFKCKGTGFIEQKNKPTISKQYSFSFLWTDPNHCNYRNGDFCKCFIKKARSESAATNIAEKALKANGSVDFIVSEVVE